MIMRIDKKGFSLIEMIVVVTILAVLVVVLAPALLQHTEKSRMQKDNSAMDEVVGAIQLAMADSEIFDEVLSYAIENNYITYTDSSGDYGKTEIDEEFWAPDGKGHAVTITFNPDNNGDYSLANGIINDMTWGNGSVAQSRVAEGVQQCYLSEMGKQLLYSRIRQTVGDTFGDKSTTYRNSSHTIFIKFDIVEGMHKATVYGEFNGTNLAEYSNAAVGSNTTEYDDKGKPSGNTPVKGTQNAVYSSSDLNGGGSSIGTPGSPMQMPTYKQCKSHKYEKNSCVCKWCGFEREHVYTIDHVLCDYCGHIHPDHVCTNWVDDKCTECGKSRIFDYKFPASGTDVRIDLDGGEFDDEGIYSLNENVEQNESFGYTGGVQTFTPQYTGFYFIEAWGAAGGKDATNGGAGGYVKAHIYLEQGKTIYISCGGKGQDRLYMNKIQDSTVGGWNGGARPGWNASNASGYSGAGGGATSITTTLRGNGELINYANHKDEVIMVAGGGAGGSSTTAGMGGTVLYAYTETNASFPGEVVNEASSDLLSGDFALGQNPGQIDGGGGAGGWVGGINGRDSSPSRSAGGGASFINTLQKCVPIELVPNNNPDAGKVKITYQADSVGLSTPTRPGYKFVGWSLEGGGSVTSNLLGGTTIFQFTEDKATLKANWEKIE